jgi:hypothetical protein
VEMEQINTPSAGVAGVGFDATYDLLVNDVWGVKGVVANIPYVNTLFFYLFRIIAG